MVKQLAQDIDIWPYDNAFHFFAEPHRLLSDSIKEETQ